MKKSLFIIAIILGTIISNLEDKEYCNENI